MESRSATAAGTASPTKASHRIDGRLYAKIRAGTGSQMRTPTMKASALAGCSVTRLEAAT